MRPLVSFLRTKDDVDVDSAESRAYIMALNERMQSMQLAKDPKADF
jgi:hypothetical protein